MCDFDFLSPPRFSSFPAAFISRSSSPARREARSETGRGLLLGAKMGRQMKIKPDPKFVRFLDYLMANREPAHVAAQLQVEGADLLRVFVELRVYIEGRSIASERQKRGREHMKIINRGVWEHGVSKEVAAWLRDRSKLAHSTNGFNRVRNVDSLAGIQIYLELRAGRKVTATELAHMLDAAYYALGRKTVADSVEIGRELRRHRQKNGPFLEILKADILSKL